MDSRDTTSTPSLSLPFCRSGSAFLPTALTLLIVLAPPAAQAQNIEALIHRIDRLERDLGVVNRNLARGSRKSLVVPKPSSTMEAPLAAKMSVQITALENEIRTLTGTQEEIQFAIKQMGMRLDKLIADMEYRLSTVEAAAAAARGPSQGLPPGAQTPSAPLGFSQTQTDGPQPAAPPGSLGTLTQSDINRFQGAAGTAPLTPLGAQQGQLTPPGQAEPTAEDLYQQATSLLRKTDYDAAESAFIAFISKYGGSEEPLLSNARYWLGEIYYVRGEYGQSATVFMESYKKGPEGRKAPDSLLKLGMSLANLGKPADACATYDKLLTEFPSASTTLRDKAQRQKEKAACN